MNKINIIFKKKKENILSVYFTAGFPGLNDTSIVIEELLKNGVDMIEIGIPFSDPLADGPTIQRSSEKALENGISLKLIFEQLSRLKNKDSFQNKQSPIILMGYLNPVIQFGVEEFCKKCSEKGVDGTIIPDLPIEEFRSQYKKIYDYYNLKNIFLVTPQTSISRIRMIDRISDGFIYVVSSASTTGNHLSLEPETRNYFGKMKSLNLKNPMMIGFGISDNKSYRLACDYAQGAIIGSAFIKVLETSTNLKKDIRDFVKKIRK